MIERALTVLIRRFVGGPADSWIYTTMAVLTLRGVRRTVGRKAMIDIGDVDSGQRIEIEHLDISHKAQIKQFKREAKVAKQQEKAEKSEAKAVKKARKADRREARMAAKAEKSAEREAERR